MFKNFILNRFVLFITLLFLSLFFFRVYYYVSTVSGISFEFLYLLIPSAMGVYSVVAQCGHIDNATTYADLVIISVISILLINQGVLYVVNRLTGSSEPVGLNIEEKAKKISRPIMALLLFSGFILFYDSIFGLDCGGFEQFSYWKLFPLAAISSILSLSINKIYRMFRYVM